MCKHRRGSSQRNQPTKNMKITINQTAADLDPANTASDAAASLKNYVDVERENNSCGVMWS